MTKRKKAREMTNIQGFLYPNIKTDFNKDLIDLSSFPRFRVGKLIWESLLGKDNKELTIDSLLNSSKFISYVEKARQDFIKESSNFHKYPKLNESDWK